VPARDLAADEDAAQVRGEHVVPLVVVDLPERAHDRSRGVVDENVDAAEALDGRAEGALERRSLTDVERQGGGTLPKTAGDRLCSLEVDVGHDDVRPASGERPCERLPDALRRSGHQCPCARSSRDRISRRSR